MAWANHERPEFKFCKGCWKTRKYDTDFSQVKRVLKDGSVAYYAQTLCKVCRKEKVNDLRRMDNRLANKQGVKGDIHLALHLVRSGFSMRHAAKSAKVARETIQKNIDLPGQIKLGRRLERLPFDIFLEKLTLTPAQLSNLTGIDEAVFRDRGQDSISLSTVDTVFTALGIPDQVAVLWPYDMEHERRQTQATA